MYMHMLLDRYRHICIGIGTCMVHAYAYVFHVRYGEKTDIEVL